ncbi:class I SAM-dependent methyltransferase [Variovorax sp. dw_308]|uniref:class I SAM-dependent methyltransferase n=1 Tax=Variovorax sp. dw_308 TaxID=2721546 RepID=UPI001C4860D2|nr:class I SAM-dependent methyltransferase [Variovorax sp. dw_308]
MSLWHQVIGPITRHFRLRRGKFILKAFPGIASMRICDLGGSRHFWDKIELPIPRGQITIYNVDDGEVQQGADVSAGDIKTVIYDGQHIPAPDRFFDLLICNSVIEHVPREQRKALAEEMRRVSKLVFCQTPAWSFPFEPHFLMPFVHWLPRRLGYLLIHVSPWRLLSHPDAPTIRNYYWGTRLLRRAEIDALFPAADVTFERAMGMVKSYYVIDRPRQAAPAGS